MTAINRYRGRSFQCFFYASNKGCGLGRTDILRVAQIRPIRLLYTELQYPAIVPHECQMIPKEQMSQPFLETFLFA